ncbi:MAG: hypothetical protein IJH87_04905 [Atopobiaceae bacterium]|nr:hypothetical protein [Atopobiaceae bacterium]
MSHIHVYSEIGPLKQVMLSRPGNELAQLHPFHLDEMLFQDTPYPALAQAEHDAYADLLRSQGVEVFYIRDLFTQAMAHPEARAAFTGEFLAASNVISPSLLEQVGAYFQALPLEEFVETVYCGIRSDNPAFEGAGGAGLGNAVSKGDLFIVEPLPNAYFARDSSINVADGVILSHMCKRYRMREPLLLKYIHRYSDLYIDEPTEDLYDMSAPWTIEGGDVMVVSDKAVCIGCFGRTQPGAIETVASSLFARGYEAVYAFHTRDPHVMHLDGMLTMIDHDVFMCNPFLKDNVSIYKLIPGSAMASGKPGVVCSYAGTDWAKVMTEAARIPAARFIAAGGGDMITGRWESSNLGNNHLTIRPGVVAAYDRNPVTLDLLEKAGITVLAFSGSELSRGKGGPRCMSMPIYREDI